MTYTRYAIGVDGRTAYARMNGKKFAREVAEFGEHVWYYKPGVVGRDKLDVRCESGIWLGIRDESGEVIIGTSKGALKARSFRRKPAHERWDKDALTQMKGLPWEPTPGLGQREIKSSVYVRILDSFISTAT